jgi:hypothetical protein
MVHSYAQPLVRVDDVAPLSNNPQYKGITRRPTWQERKQREDARYRAAVARAPHLASDKAFQVYRDAHPAPKLTTDQAIDAAYAAQDVVALRWAIYEHIARNPELAEVVSSEALRSLPWLPCDNPLKPYDGRVPFSWFINMKTKSRSRDLQRKNVWARGGDVHLDSFSQEPALYNKDLPEAAEHTLDDKEVARFLASLSADERALAEDCLSRGPQAKGFMAIVHKAVAWGKTAQSIRSSAPCGCHSCSTRPWASEDALRAVDDLGCLSTTRSLLKRLPARATRPAEWQLERTYTAAWSDPWKGRWSKAKSTNPDDWQGIPAKLYQQITGEVAW